MQIRQCLKPQIILAKSPWRYSRLDWEVLRDHSNRTIDCLAWETTHREWESLVDRCLMRVYSVLGQSKLWLTLTISLQPLAVSYGESHISSSSLHPCYCLDIVLAHWCPTYYTLPNPVTLFKSFTSCSFYSFYFYTLSCVRKEERTTSYPYSRVR